jgi:hypothetical protein
LSFYHNLASPTLEMADLHRALWFEPGSTWDSPKDVLLVAQLATLAAGFTSTVNLASRVTPTATAHAFIRCIEVKTKESGGCQSTLALIQYIDPSNASGPCRVQLPPRATNLKTAKPALWEHHSHPDSGHLRISDPIQVSFSLPVRTLIRLAADSNSFPQTSTTPIVLDVGLPNLVIDAAKVNALEASIRAAARRSGCSVTVIRSKDILFKCRSKSASGACSFQVRLARKAHEPPSWTCTEIDPHHTCDPGFSKPSAALTEVLDFFVSFRLSLDIVILAADWSYLLTQPPITLVAGLVGKSKLQQSRKIALAAKVRLFSSNALRKSSSNLRALIVGFVEAQGS